MVAWTCTLYDFFFSSLVNMLAAAHEDSEAVNKIIDLLLVEVHFMCISFYALFSLLLMDMARSRVCSRQDRFESVESCLRYFHFLVADFLPEAAKHIMNNAKHMYMHLGCCLVHENRLKKFLLCFLPFYSALYIHIIVDELSWLKGGEGKIVNCKTGSRSALLFFILFFCNSTIYTSYWCRPKAANEERDKRRKNRILLRQRENAAKMCKSNHVHFYIIFENAVEWLGAVFFCFYALFFVPISFRRQPHRIK